MAPAFTPRRSKRENQFFEPGVQGRKTGITLKDTGVRDEYGMEPLEGIFSSPEKSPPKRMIPTSNTLTSEAMAIAQSPAPEPAEVLTGRRSAKTLFPPPFGRSPIKTAIGSSPRRQSSIGPASPVRSLAKSPLRASRVESQPVIARKLDFSAQGEPILKSVEASTGNNMVRRGRSGGKPRRDIFALASPEEDGRPLASASIPEESEPQINGFQHSSPLPVQQDDSLQLLDQDGEANDALASVEQHEDPFLNDSDGQLDSRMAYQSRKGINGRAGESHSLQSAKRASAPDGKLRHSSDDSAKDEAYHPEPSPGIETEPMEQSPPQQIAKRGRGRPRKSDNVAVHEDNAASIRPQGKKRKALKPAPSDRGPNAKITAKRQKSETGSVVERAASAQENRRPGPRSLQILRQGTPADEDGMQKTRFGRASVKPVAWWCGERVDRDYDGTIKNIVRAQSIEPAKRARAASKKPSRAKREMSVLAEEGEDEEDIEDWELDPGVVSGQVRAWDPELGAGVEDSDNEMDLAFAANAIETRDVPGANFKYSKVLSMSFFGSGLVDIPPNGFKSAKNSRKMEMVFMVHTGKVCVRVEDVEFTISKGGVWRVPRGNTYSIQNWSKSSARIFFAQACQTEPEYEAE